MSNYIYNKAKERFLNGQLSWGVNTSGDTFKAVLLTNAYVPSPNHVSLLDVPVASRIATSAPLTGKNVVNGIASANPASFTNLTANGANIRYIVIIKQNTGDSESISYLVAFIDTATGITTGLPVTQTSATIEWAIDPDTAAPNNKRLIFKL
jgi:hypothetical protein